ncbi:MAG: DNA topoisomerase-1, partial [Planctomycetota bacterium]
MFPAAPNKATRSHRKRMAKKNEGTPVVIVESPAKARTIGKYLGSNYRIEASIGHIRDLPSTASEVPAKLKGEKWAKLGINVEDGFKALYVVPAAKKEHLKKLRDMVKDASCLYLATDEDREGESISWHLLEELKPKCPTKRLVFHEITKTAILKALESPREIDMDLVEAQETRRLVDRLYGYTVSPLLWKKVKPKLSAGRVQSVAVRVIVERERERMRFKPADYWSLEVTFAGESSSAPGEAIPFPANLHTVDGKRVASGRDFEQETGELKDGGKLPGGGVVAALNEATTTALAAELKGQKGNVTKVDQKPYTERPQPPFTTSTLQQEAARKLRFAAQRTMRAAQRLYENGFITYMRTDSTTLSSQAVDAARSLIGKEFGTEYLPSEPRTYATKVKNAQEAHEAIRPAGEAFTHPNDLSADMGVDERKLYELIWRRTVASQMRDASGQRTTMTLIMKTKDHGDARFTATGRTVDFAGYRLAYVEDLDDTDAEAAKADAERVLPNLKEGEKADAQELKASGHTTQPPGRITEAGLIKELEARGIGRPSTYASIIETIVRRNYCWKKGSALVPTFTAFAVVDLLAQYLGWLVDYTFTAQMENDLDEISNGRASRTDYLKQFFLGNGSPGLQDQITNVQDDIDPRKICSIPVGNNEDGELVEVRVGRYGPFLSCGDKTAPVPDETPPDEMTLERALELIAKGAEGPKELGDDPDSGMKVYLKVGRFGPYFQLGETPEQVKGKKTKKEDMPKMASLLTGMEVETVTLADGLAVLSLPRTVGVGKPPLAEEPEELPLLAANGRYGPYLKWGKDTRSIPAGGSPLTFTMEEALKLYAEPKQRGRSAPKILKELGEHPDSKEPIKLHEGRFGPYVTDGTTNASVPKGEDANELSLVRALELIEARAAKGPAKKKKKKAAKKKTAKKAAKKAPAKKASKKAAKKVAKKVAK